MKILIADDEEFEREHLRTVLEKAGHEIIDVESGIDAYESFQKQRFDLVITDYRMPGKLNGLDVLTSIKSLNLDARIWLMSNCLRDETVKLAYSLGAEKVVWKTSLEHELYLAQILKD